MNPKGFEIGTPEYKDCIIGSEKKEIAKAEEEKRIAEEKKKAAEILSRNRDEDASEKRR